MARYNNPAGRLWEIFTNLSQNTNGKRSQLASQIGVSDTWAAISKAVLDIYAEYEVLKESTEQYKDNPSKYNLYLSKLPIIAECVNGFNLNMKNNTYNATVSSAALVALEFMGADLPQEESRRDELGELRKLCDELQNEIHKSSLNKSLKAWLLDLVRLMRDGIDRYQIRGSRGLRREFHEMLGSIIVHYNNTEEIKRESPTTWEKVKRGFKLFVSLSCGTEQIFRSVDHVRKAIGFLTGDQSPASTIEG